MTAGEEWKLELVLAACDSSVGNSGLERDVLQGFLVAQLHRGGDRSAVHS
jgi:hypothetical protein